MTGTGQLARGRFRLSGAVLTHSARGDAAAGVVAQAPPGLLGIVADPEPDGPPTLLRTVLAAWSAVPEGSTHHLVLRDDMVLAEGVWERLLDAIEVVPESALALFASCESRNGAMVRIGALTGANWVRAVGEYIPCAALVLPRQVALSYAHSAREFATDGWPDDILMQWHLRETGVRCLIAVPNLAEHADGPSAAGNAFGGSRRSACFLPVAPAGPPRIAETTPALVPFLKNGVAQCVERSPGGGWLHLETAARLRLLGAPAERLHPAYDTALERGVWLTGYALGLLSRARSGPPRAVRRATAIEALRTIGLGGGPQHPDKRTELRYEELACRAVESGSTDRLCPARPRHHIALRPADDAGASLLAHLVAYLAERGVTATIAADGADPLTLQGDLYGPGCGPEGVIGSLVWQALRARPILLTDAHPALIWPRHVREAAESYAGRLPLAARAAYPLLGFALAVAEAVRPVPVHDLRETPETATATVGEEMRFRLHHYAQWLAYEWRGTARVARSTAEQPSVR